MRSVGGRIRRGAVAAMIASVLMGGAGSPVAAQTATPVAKPKPAATQQPVRRGRIVKRPLVDLEVQAQGRRPGQVMPGDPPPEKFAPPVALPEPVRPATEPAAPPAPVATPPATLSEDASTGQPLKPAPVPVDPSAGPRSAPVPATNPEPRPAPVPVNPEPASPSATAEPLDRGVTLVPGSASASADDSIPLKPAVVAIDPMEGSASDGPASPPVVSVPDESVGATVRIVSASPTDVEWRPMGGPWGSPTVGREDTGRFEVRTGLNGEAVVDIDGRVEVRVLRMSRVRVERRSAELGAPAVLIERGGVDLRARSAEPVEVWVRTPDRTAGFASLPGVRVRYSAFSGTSLERPQLDHP